MINGAPVICRALASRLTATRRSRLCAYVDGCKDGSDRVRGRTSAGVKIVLVGFRRPPKINAAAAEIIFRARCE